jgi:hypothetical protein
MDHIGIAFIMDQLASHPTPRTLGFSTLRSVGLLLVLCGVVCDIIPYVKRSVTSTVIYLLFVMHPICLHPCTQLVAPSDLAFMDAADQGPPKRAGDDWTIDELWWSSGDSSRDP